MQLEAATGKPIDELLFGEWQAASSSADSRPKGPHLLRRLEKKVREIERLQQQASDGRELSAEERTKVGELLVLQRQIALLKQPTPGPTPVQTPGSTQTPSSELSGASTQIHAAASAFCLRVLLRAGQGAVATYLAADARTDAPHFGQSAAAAGGRAKRARVRSRGGSTGGTREVEQATWHSCCVRPWTAGATRHCGSSPCVSSPSSTSPTWLRRQSSSSWNFGRRVRR